MSLSFENMRLVHQAGAGLLLGALALAWLPLRRQWPFAAILSLLASGALIAEAIGRTVLLNRAPVVGGYENTLVAASFIAVVSTLFLLFGTREIRLGIARLLLPWALAAFGFGMIFSARPAAIGADGRGALAYAHALVGWVDFALLLTAAMSGVGLLVASDEGRAAWQATMTRALGAGFALLTATMASGSLLSFAVYGSWYQWQTVETFAAALWIAIGVALHAFLLFGWREKRLAKLSVGLLPLLLLTFWSWSLYSGTYHYFEKLIRI